MPLEIRSTADFAKMLASFEGLQEHLPATIAQAVSNSVQAMSAYLIRDRLSRKGPYTLGVKFGKARQSIAQGVTVSDKSVGGYFGSPLRYVRAHNQGFAGTVRVRAHSRRTRKGGSAVVRAHDMRMNMRARRFFQKTLEVGLPGVERRVLTALKVLAITGKVPSFSQIEGGSGA